MLVAGGGSSSPSYNDAMNGGSCHPSIKNTSRLENDKSIALNNDKVGAGNEYALGTTSVVMSQNMGAKGKWGNAQCIPKINTIPKYETRSTKTGHNIQHMRYHTVIGKFMGIYPLEKALEWWIQTRWKPKGEINPNMGSKGFFKVIFTNVHDKYRVFKNDP